MYFKIVKNTYKKKQIKRKWLYNECGDFFMLHDLLISAILTFFENKTKKRQK